MNQIKFETGFSTLNQINKSLNDKNKYLHETKSSKTNKVHIK